MEITEVHSLNIEIEELKEIQKHLYHKIRLKNTFKDKDVQYCAGIDLAYWEKERHGELASF